MPASIHTADPILPPVFPSRFDNLFATLFVAEVMRLLSPGGRFSSPNFVPKLLARRCPESYQIRLRTAFPNRTDFRPRHSPETAANPEKFQHRDWLLVAESLRDSVSSTCEIPFAKLLAISVVDRTGNGLPAAVARQVLASGDRSACRKSSRNNRLRLLKAPVTESRSDSATSRLQIIVNHRPIRLRITRHLIKRRHLRQRPERPQIVVGRRPKHDTPRPLIQQM